MGCYWLKLYDQNLIKFTMDHQVGEGFKATVLWKDESKENLLPVELTQSANDSSLTRWLEKRIIPRNRAFVEEILKTYGLSPKDVKGIIDICKGLSLNDSYWVVPEGFYGTFAAYNLYQNQFSRILGLVAYTGASGGKTPFTTSPEYTTGGMLRKAWRNQNGKIVLYKGGTSGASNTGLEPYSEYYACQIADKMGLNPVMYGLSKWKGILASTCPLFTDIDTAFVYIGRIVKEGGYKAVLEWAKAHSSEMHEYFRSILCFDAIIYNEDRHFGNFGVLRDNKSGEIIKPAPIFDNGLSLFNYGTLDDLKNINKYRKTRLTHSGESFDDIVRVFCGSNQKKQLLRLINFRFTRHPSYNWTSERYKIIESFIPKRVQELMDMIQE